MIRAGQTEIDTTKLSLPSKPIAPTKKWSSTKGKFQVEAQYVALVGEDLRLKKSDDSTITVPLVKLSPDSRSDAKRIGRLFKTYEGAIREIEKKSVNTKQILKNEKHEFRSQNHPSQ